MSSPRGTTNTNARGSTSDRAARRRWLVETFRADRDYSMYPIIERSIIGVPRGTGIPACRCYRCGFLLTEDTVTPDRIIPGCHGGTYRRSNIRPCCLFCNSSTGATTRRKEWKPS